VCRAGDASPPPPATTVSRSRSSATGARIVSALREKIGRTRIELRIQQHF
jgi:hypothetical protein